MEIEAKIAALLSDTKLAVNVGSLSGVAKGDDVVIFETVSVTDPDTGEPLGEVKLVKLKLRIEDVQERLAVAVVPTENASLSRIITQIAPLGPIARLTENPFDTDNSRILVDRGQSVVVILKSTAAEK